MSNTKRQCEVLVVGAGVSGMSAAISASRQGANVILIEKKEALGGIARAGLNRFICGLYANGKHMPRNTLNKGIAREICTYLKKAAPTKTVVRLGKVYGLPFLTRDLMSVYSSLICKESNLEILNNTCVIATKTVKRTIKEVKVKRSKATFSITPKAVIDCSGEGDVIRLSGARYQLAQRSRRQLAGYSIRIKGIRNANEMLAINVPYCIRKAINEKKLPSYLKFTTMSYIEGTDEGIIKLSVIPVDGTDDVNRVKSDAYKVQGYLASEIPSLRKARIVEMSPNILNREGLRVRGEYTLRTADVVKARKFDDGAVKNAWPIEVWDQKKGPQYQYLKPGEHYEIPSRCLKSKDILNLFAAGRCISASHEALGSARVMGTCMSLGEEAGRAAAKYSE